MLLLDRKNELGIHLFIAENKHKTPDLQLTFDLKNTIDNTSPAILEPFLFP